MAMPEPKSTWASSPGSTLHAPKGQDLLVLQAPHKTAHTGILAREAVLADEVLPDALGAESLVQFGHDDVAKRLTQTGPA